MTDVAGTAEMRDGDTKRLSLPRWRREFAPGLAEVNAEPEVMRFLNGGTPLTRVESSMVSDRVLQHWKEYRFGLWAVIEKENHGMLGFRRHLPPALVPRVGEARRGRLAAPRRRLGVRLRDQEAGEEALRVGFDHLGLDEIYAFVHPDNHRSAAVSARLGMTLEERVRRPDRPHDLDVYVAPPLPSVANSSAVSTASLAVSTAPRTSSRSERLGWRLAIVGGNMCS